MAAVGTATPWSTQDDVLLKNAIEDGASLESLAKGAVQFSRRFTITELQDRWYSLLYDLNTSIEASVRMAEIEHSTIKRTSKLKRTDQSKLKEDNRRSRKRKADSIRKCYHALRKRMCTSLNPDNVNFLGDSNIISQIETPGLRDMVGGQIANHLELQDAGFDDLNVFPQVARNNAMLCDVNEFLNEHPNRLEDSIEQDRIQNEILLGSSMAMPGNCTRLVKMDPSKELQDGHYIFPSVVATHVSNGKAVVSPDFRGDNILNAPCADDETSFYPVHHASTSPAVLDWKEIGAISVQELADDANIIGNNHMSGNEMKNSTDYTEDYFVDFDESLFDFINDEEELEDTIEHLLNSPDDANDEMPSIPGTDPALLVAYPDTVGTDPEDKIVVGDNHLGKHARTLENQAPTSSTVSLQLPDYCGGVVCCLLNTEDPEIPYNDHIIFPSKPPAALAHRRRQSASNTAMRSSKDDYAKKVGQEGTVQLGRKQFGDSNLGSRMRGLGIQLNHEVNEFGIEFETYGVELLNSAKSPSSNIERPCRSGLAIKKEYSELPPVRQSDHRIIDKSCCVLDSGLVLPVAGETYLEGQPMATAGDQAYTADLMNTEPGGEQMLSYGSEEQYSDSDTDIPSFFEVEAMVLDMDLEPDDDDSFGSWDALCHREGCGDRQHAKDLDVSLSLYLDVIVEEPYGSLGICLSTNSDVCRVHLDGVLVRKIIRLEQIAHSDMQRDMAKHRAIAILYNLHSKYYIKKSEVSLGRGSNGVHVDIDLEREGYVSSISRQQAIIKMDKNGTFYMKNLGKRTIYVDDKKKVQDQSVRLHSNCLIQIREIWFIFDYLTDSKLVKQFLGNNA